MHRLADHRRRTGHVSSRGLTQPHLSPLTALITHLPRPKALAGAYLMIPGDLHPGQPQTAVPNLPGTHHLGLPPTAQPWLALEPAAAGHGGTLLLGPCPAALHPGQEALTKHHGTHPRGLKQPPQCVNLRPLLRQTLTVGVWHRVWMGTTRMALMHTLLHHPPPQAPARPRAAHLTSQVCCPTKLSIVEYPGDPEPRHPGF